MEKENVAKRILNFINVKDKIEENKFKMIENHFSILENRLKKVSLENKIMEIKMEQIYLIQSISSRYFFIFGSFIALISILLTIYSVIKIWILIPIIILIILAFSMYIIKEKVEDKNFKNKIVKDEINYLKSRDLSKEEIRKKLKEKFGYLLARG